MQIQTVIVLFSLLFLLSKSNLSSQPIYAAIKGESCASCHVNPAGGGARKIVQTSAGFINDSLSLGADLRGGYSNDGNPLTDYTFKSLEQRFYVVAEPVSELTFVYSLESGSTAEAYGFLQSKEWWDVYARFGKFFLPYGLQISDPDNSSYIKTSPFAPSGVGFTLQPGLTDFGAEIGLAPKKDYFLNVSVTNGSNAKGTGSAKAVTARAGWVGKNFGLGVTGFQKAVFTTPKDQSRRYGIFGEMKFGPLIVLGELGQGYDVESSTQARKYVSAAYVEVNYKFGKLDSFQNDFLLKGKLDYINSDKQPSEKFRYTLGLEWFLKDHISFEGQYRIVREKPESDNDQAIILGHLWF